MLGECVFQNSKVFQSDSCSDSLDSCFDNELLSQRCPILGGFSFNAKNGWFFSEQHVSVFLRNPVRLSQHCPGVICSQVLVFFSKPNSFQMSPYLLGFDFGGTLRLVDGSRSFPEMVVWNAVGKCDVVRPFSGRCEKDAGHCVQIEVTFTHSSHCYAKLPVL